MKLFKSGISDEVLQVKKVIWNRANEVDKGKKFKTSSLSEIVQGKR